MTIDLYKKRSYVRCLKDGFEFLCSNLWLVTKVMMPYFLVVAALLTMLNASQVYINVCMQAAMEVDMSAVWMVFTLFPLLLIAMMLTQGRLFLLYRRMAGMEKNPPLWMMALKSLLGIVLSPLFFTPIVYIYYAWMMKGDGAFPIKEHARKGLRRWGSILGVVLLGGFVCMVVSSIMMLPYITAISTYFASIEGKVNFGDAALIPTTGYVLMMVACVLGYAMIQLFAVFNQTALLYLYGTINEGTKVE